MHTKHFHTHTQTYREGFKAMMEPPGSYCAYACMYITMCLIKIFSLATDTFQEQYRYVCMYVFLCVCVCVCDVCPCINQYMFLCMRVFVCGYVWTCMYEYDWYFLEVNPFSSLTYYNKIRWLFDSLSHLHNRFTISSPSS